MNCNGLKSIRQQLDSSTPPTEISLSAFSDVEDEIDAFLASLQESDSVKSIHLRTDFLMAIEEDAVMEFFRVVGMRLATLEELHIQSSSKFHIEIIPGDALLPLRYARGLRLLEIQDMQVSASYRDFIDAVAKTMENHPALETVVLQNFFANDVTNQSADILDCLLMAGADMPALKTLELTGCGSQPLCGHVVRLLSTAALQRIFGSKTLTRLHLSFLELNDEHFEALIGQLVRNTTLTNLALDYHDLDSRGFKSMMLALEDNTAIKHLSLRSLRDIGLEGFAQAILMLQYNYTVETLAVTASPVQQAEIDLYLRMNGAGRILLRNPSVTLNEWIEILARHNDDLDVVRHLLQEVPGLCSAGTFAASEQRRRCSITGSSTGSVSAGFVRKSSSSAKATIPVLGLEPHSTMAVTA